MEERHKPSCDMCLEEEASEYRNDGLCEECGDIVDHGVHEEIINLDYNDYLPDDYDVASDSDF